MVPSPIYIASHVRILHFSLSLSGLPTRIGGSGVHTAVSSFRVGARVARACIVHMQESGVKGDEGEVRWSVGTQYLMGTTIFVRCRTVKDRGPTVHSTGVLLANRLLSPFSEWLGSLWVQSVLWVKYL